jgi:hypothetical protein
MGRMQAEGFSDAVKTGLCDIDVALHAHLTGNHYPPIPLEMVDSAKAAIAAFEEEDYDRIIHTPYAHVRYGYEVPARVLVEHMHLDCFINSNDDEE